LADSADSTPQVSGRIIRGLRVIPLNADQAPFELTVYRGDYVVFRPAGFGPDPILAIPRLDVSQPLGEPGESPPYFKMKTPGAYDFTLGPTRGRIRVLTYRHPSYHEISADQAAQRIAQGSPLILDVRTPREFQQGHIAGARLLPVQELQRRLGELQQYKQEEILLYCATGNRSTVAAKILADQGFENLTNLRGGVREWLRENHPLQR
jgi:rhodanese-related sulfurtransferase